MNENEQDIRVVAELLVQLAGELGRGIAIVQGHGAAQTGHACPLPGLQGCLGNHRALERRQRFFTSPLLHQGQSLFRGYGGPGARGRGGSFRRLCSETRNSQKNYEDQRTKAAKSIYRCEATPMQERPGGTAYFQKNLPKKK